MFFSAIHPSVKLSLLLWSARVGGMVGCLHTLHCGDAWHEQLISGGAKNNNNGEPGKLASPGMDWIMGG